MYYNCNNTVYLKIIKHIKKTKMKPDFRNMTKEELMAHKANALATRAEANWTAMTKKDIAKMESRNKIGTGEIFSDETHAEMLHRYSRQNAPSSLR